MQGGLLLFASSGDVAVALHFFSEALVDVAVLVLLGVEHVGELAFYLDAVGAGVEGGASAMLFLFV